MCILICHLLSGTRNNWAHTQCGSQDSAALAFTWGWIAPAPSFLFRQLGPNISNQCDPDWAQHRNSLTSATPEASSKKEKHCSTLKRQSSVYGPKGSRTRLYQFTQMYV